MLHRRFQVVQIHRTQAMRQCHVQQFMFRHDRFALEDMGDGMVQGLIFHQGNVAAGGLNEPTRGVFAAIAAHPADNCDNCRSRTSAVEMPLTFFARL